MSTFVPVRTVRPAPGYAQTLVSPPYDVLSRDEARALSAGNPHSYLHVVRADADFPDDVDPHEARIHAAARETFARWLDEGILVVDAEPTYTIYRESFGGRTQVGVVGGASIDEYVSGAIKRHEVTLVDKEQDRITHFSTVGAHTEPIWLAHRPQPDLAEVYARYLANAPSIDVTDAAGVRHELWPVHADADVDAIRTAFADLDALYIADGHHRAASAAKVGLRRREEGAPPGPHDYVLAVAFACDQLHVMDYNRVITDLGAVGATGLTDAIEAAGFGVEARDHPVRPTQPGTFGLYVRGRWYHICAPHTPERRGVDALDVAILHDLLLEPLLGIADPRTDPRIEFVGGIRGLDPLVTRADATAGAAVVLRPVAMETVMDIADAGDIMPPKSTWFEPKLASGLFAHLLEDPTS